MAHSTLYQPLGTYREEFRVLRIQPSDDFNSVITCQFFTASLAQEPLYNVLSYEWGKCSANNSILVNGITVQVTPNLAAALRRIRTPHSEVILWVDALCINQHDVSERNAQVAMMGRLYSNTALTYAWLGEDDNGSAARTFQFLRCFLGDFGKFVDNVDNFAVKASKYLRSGKLYEGYNEVFENIRTGKLSINGPNIEDFHQVSRLPYWLRTWIQQELILPPKVLLLSGSVSVPLNLMIAFYILNIIIGIRATGWTESSHSLSNMLRIRYNPPVVQLVASDMKNMIALISCLRPCRAKDPCDKIYDILGIQHGVVPIMVGYGKPVTQVFVDFVRNLAEESGRIYLRQFPRITTDPLLLNLPSWTPQFREDAIEYSYYAGVHKHGGRKAKTCPTSCPHLLRTTGCTTGTAQSVFQFSPKDKASDVLLEFIGSYINMVHPTGATFLQVLFCNILEFQNARCLQGAVALSAIRIFLHLILKYGKERDVLNQRFNESVHEYNLMNVFQSIPEEISTSLEFARITGAIDHLIRPYQNAQDHIAFLQMTPQQRMAPFWGPEVYPRSFLAGMEWRVPSEYAQIQSMTMRLEKFINKESLIITAHGYTGFATYDTSVGDLVCVVAGCQWPAIIRPSGTYYKIVGGSFIFGIMDYELFKDGRLTDDSQKIFELV